jgi:hypothetical protein
MEIKNSKYNIADIVWFLKDKTIQNGFVTGISSSVSQEFYLSQIVYYVKIQHEVFGSSLHDHLSETPLRIDEGHLYGSEAEALKETTKFPLYRADDKGNYYRFIDFNKGTMFNVIKPDDKDNYSYCPQYSDRYSHHSLKEITKDEFFTEYDKRVNRTIEFLDKLRKEKPIKYLNESKQIEEGYLEQLSKSKVTDQKPLL